MTEKPFIYGAPYSVYVRIVRLALAEKGVDYELVPVDIFASEGPPADYLDLHPFGRIPAFEHAGFCLYETGAITRYVDEAFEGPPLQPAGVRERARCNQVISIADNYAYPQLVWGVYVERISKPKRGAVTDEARLAAAIPKARTCLKALSDLMADKPWLAGRQLSLADLYLAPMLDYFQMAPEGREMVQQYPSLADWWARVASRPSMTGTAFG
ncbi:MAG TPA: glutathione S-transferase family protein [Bradyrhizobium sp.]|uniref:glutathione S-transferase family protein n=1 Tax=Bradyrhizobium sp. TaxID=376 RepID=UPI002C108133|nr:glutathione S-transferase family protein [Bradyrhizobium sp.]HLZ05687.1 glutathione S-transferase family protein [Bradyrhizobium sp.]